MEELAGPLLKAALDKRRRKNKAYSSRALARDLDLSPSFLSRVLNGKKLLSFETALRIADHLELKGKTKNQFLRAVVVEGLADQIPSKEVHLLLFGPAVSGGFVSMDQDRFEFFSSWYHVAILDLTACAGFKNSVRWIAGTLGIDPSMASDAVARLLRLGLLKKVGSRLVKTENKLEITTKRTDPALRKFHTQMIDKAKLALQSAEETDFKRRSISGVTMAIDSSRIEEARKRIASFREEMFELLAADVANPDEVYQLNLQLFPLTKNKGRGAQ